MKYILKKQDLENNPLLKHCKEGDEIEIPEPQMQNNDADDTGGSNPPPDKERPDKP